METLHLFEDGYYEISNKAVAKCFLFSDEKDCLRFKEKLANSLSPICDILAFGLLRDEFRILIKLKSRSIFETYFMDKYEYNSEEGEIIPETTYLFAQAMANLQSGYAKWFNHKYKRDGGLMCGRYKRRLIEQEEDLDSTIESINSLSGLRKRTGIWTFRRKEIGFGISLKASGTLRSSGRIYAGEDLDSGIEGFKHRDLIYLRGHFENLPPKRLPDYQSKEKLANLMSFLFLKLRK